MKLYECILQGWVLRKENGKVEKEMPPQTVYVVAHSLKDCIDILVDDCKDTSPDIKSITNLKVVIQDERSKYPITRMGFIYPNSD